jgi:hypothetical protein
VISAPWRLGADEIHENMRMTSPSSVNFTSTAMVSGGLFGLR